MAAKRPNAKPVHTVLMQDLPAGDRGVDITVSYMLDFMRQGGQHPAVRAIAESLRRTSRAATLRACYDYCLARVRYKLDPEDEELIRAPWLTLTGVERAGDCDCMTIALGALCAALKIDCWVRVIDYREDTDEFTHVYLMAAVGGGWVIPMDLVMTVIGFGNERWPLKRTKEYKL